MLHLLSIWLPSGCGSCMLLLRNARTLACPSSQPFARCLAVLTMAWLVPSPSPDACSWGGQFVEIINKPPAGEEQPQYTVTLDR